jgi:hypothetical protein|tara:strand:- start:502 stop:723 length:222 start_codon:yes stop_codon:yes gene_type:complete
MKDYIKGFAIFAALTIGGLFGLGFCVGIIMGITGNADQANHLEQAVWFNALIFVSMPIIAFFAYKFSVDKIFK